MRVVFDTNVLLSATLWDLSVSHKLLMALIRLDVAIFSSSFIISEYKRVLKRDFGYDDESISSISDRILMFASLVIPISNVDVVKDDPSDNRILECAIDSCSGYVVTYDKHLLSIKEYCGIKILRPEEILRILT